MGLSLVLLYAGDQHVNYAPTWCNYFWIYDAVRYLNSETKSYDLFVFNCFPQKHRFCIPICSMVLLVVVVVVVVAVVVVVVVAVVVVVVLVVVVAVVVVVYYYY